MRAAGSSVAEPRAGTREHARAGGSGANPGNPSSPGGNPVGLRQPSRHSARYSPLDSPVGLRQPGRPAAFYSPVGLRQPGRPAARYSPVGCRTTKPAFSGRSGRQRGPCRLEGSLAELVSRRMPATVM